MKFILAVSDDNVIAVNGKMPWHIKHDFQWFKMNTYGCPIVMGRKTWDSIGRKALPGRTNVVVSRRMVPGVKTIITGWGLEDYLNAHPDALVIGGACLCEQLWTTGDVLILTRVHKSYGNGLKIELPEFEEMWSKSFDGYTFSVNIIT